MLIREVGAYSRGRLFDNHVSRMGAYSRVGALKSTSNSFISVIVKTKIFDAVQGTLPKLLGLKK